MQRNIIDVRVLVNNIPIKQECSSLLMVEIKQELITRVDEILKRHDVGVPHVSLC